MFTDKNRQKEGTQAQDEMNATTPPENIDSEASLEKTNPVQDSLFSDAFISYEPNIIFPDISIAQKNVFGNTLPEKCQLTIQNRANFSYSAHLSNLPAWCFTSCEAVELSPGESTVFSLGINVSALPPGENISAAQITLVRPFMRLFYPIHLKISTECLFTVPQVSVEILSPKEKKLRVVVTNGGKGILQGYCYNRATRKIDNFNLASFSKKSRGLKAPDIEKQTDKKKQKFKIEHSFKDISNARNRILIMTNCPNPRFRRIEIDPEEHLRTSERFANRTALHFPDMTLGKKKEIILTLLHHAYSRKCKIRISDHLQSMVRVASHGAGRVCFQCEITDMESLGDLAIGFVEFMGSGSHQHRLPIAISPDPTTK